MSVDRWKIGQFGGFFLFVRFYSFWVRDVIRVSGEYLQVIK